MLLAAEKAAPAGGAALDQILIAMVVVGLAYVPLAWFLVRERGGHRTLVGRAADWISTKDGLPRWAGLPSYLAILSLITAAFGVYWDVPLHMQYGRDEGPLANPSHYPILFGILGFLAAGVISAALATDPLPRRTVKLTPRWRAPMGSMILIGAGVIAAAGFPADDLWHRLFGQDVTEWGPTHVMMIGGAVTCILGVPLLFAEGAQVGRPPLARALPFGGLATGGLRLAGRVLPPVRREAPASVTGDRSAWASRLVITIWVGVCIIPMAFLMEFDLGIPQFPAATLFVIAGFLSGWVFTAGRLFFGPGGALVTWLVYFTIRVLILLITLPVPHIHHARWLLFLGPAVCIELLALVVRSRGPVFAGVAGLLAGAVGLATEWWWMGAFLPPPMPPSTDHMPLMLAIGAAASFGGGLLGWSFAQHLEQVADLPRASAPLRTAADGRGRWLGTVGTVVFVGLMGAFAVPVGHGEVAVKRSCDDTGCRTSYQPTAGSDALTAKVSYDDDCIGTEGCASRVTVQLADDTLARDAVWFSAIGYQGFHEHDPNLPGEGLVLTDMEPTGRPGEYRTADPLPLYGDWKAFVRLHAAPRTMLALPLHMPEDTAIDSNASGLVQTANGDEVPFVKEPMLLQRERKGGVPAWLWSVMYGVVVASWLALLAFYGWAYAAAARPRTSGVRGGDRESQTA